MTRVRGLVGAVVLGMAAITLSGCVYAQIPAESSPDPVPEVSESTAPPEGTDAGDTDAGGLPEELTFAAGQELPDGVYIQWGDGFIADEGWKVVAPDNGHGEWTYGTVDDACTARFWQGLIRDSEVKDEGVRDDQKGSDLLIGSVLGLSEAEVAGAVNTSEFSYLVGGTGGVENRWASGQDGDRSWIVAARSFTKPGVGLWVAVECYGVAAQPVMDEVNEKNPVVVN